MNAAAIAFGKPNARIIRPVFKDQPLPVRGDLGFVSYEIFFRHSKECSYAGYLAF